MSVEVSTPSNVLLSAPEKTSSVCSPKMELILQGSDLSAPVFGPFKLSMGENCSVSLSPLLRLLTNSASNQADKATIDEIYQCLLKRASAPKCIYFQSLKAVISTLCFKAHYGVYIIPQHLPFVYNNFLTGLKFIVS